MLAIILQAVVSPLHDAIAYLHTVWLKMKLWHLGFHKYQAGLGGEANLKQINAATYRSQTVLHLLSISAVCFLNAHLWIFY